MCLNVDFLETDTQYQSQWKDMDQKQWTEISDLWRKVAFLFYIPTKV